MIETQSRYRGSLLGLAVGDALGTTLEFQSPRTFSPIDNMVGGGPFDLQPGEWTDDTSMALCLAESLIESKGSDLHDQIRRYCRWKNEGYLSSNGSCFDIGATVAEALRRFERTGDPISGSTSPNSAGNGSLMRLAPVPLFYARDPRAAIEFAVASSRTTHGAHEGLDACRYFAALIVGAVAGRSKEELLADRFEPFPGAWADVPLAAKIASIAAGSFKRSEPPHLSGTGGYVVPSLEVALWAFHHSDNFRDGALMAVNLGFDADTYGAIYGQLAGAFYGENGIHHEWRKVLAERSLITSLADRLFTMRPWGLQPVAASMSPVKTSHSHPIRVDFVDTDALQASGRIGMTFAPGKKHHGMTAHWNRDLDTDLARLRDEYHTDLLVSLIEDHEFVALNITELPERVSSFGIEMLWYPIPDGSVPRSIEELFKTVTRILAAVNEGQTVVIHCMGGLGRTGLVAAACLMVSTNLTPYGAIDAVKRARPGAFENVAQEDYITTFRDFIAADRR